MNFFPKRQTVAILSGIVILGLVASFILVAHANDQLYKLSFITSPTIGGSISGSSDTLYSRDETVSLTAYPSDGYIFRYWGGSCSGTSQTCEVTMNATRYVAAYFMKNFISTTRSPAYTGSLGIDPGTGTWTPVGTSKFYVVDPTVNSTIAYLPSCINEKGYSESCNDATYYRDGKNVISLEKGTIISLRYISKSIISDNNSMFSLKGRDGGANYGRNITMSLSRTPGDFSNSDCTFQGNANISLSTLKTSIPSIDPAWSRIGYTPTKVRGCVVEPDTKYYLNLRMDEGCPGSDVTCTFRIQESDHMI